MRWLPYMIILTGAALSLVVGLGGCGDHKQQRKVEIRDTCFQWYKDFYDPEIRMTKPNAFVKIDPYEMSDMAQMRVRNEVFQCTIGYHNKCLCEPVFHSLAPIQQPQSKQSP